MHTLQETKVKFDNERSYYKSLGSYQAFKDSKEEAYKRAEQNMTKLLSNLSITS